MPWAHASPFDTETPASDPDLQACTQASCVLNALLPLLQGLGKTAQSIATLAFQKQFLGLTGPHIVIAPLTTLGHWQREIQTWTDLVRSACLPSLT